jgi:hypothetical protein
VYEHNHEFDYALRDDCARCRESVGLDERIEIQYVLNERPFMMPITRRRGKKKGQAIKGIAVEWEDGKTSALHQAVKVIPL